MRRRTRTATVDGASATSLRLVHNAQSARVDASHQRLQTIVGRPHAPAEAREAADELTVALREATQSTAQMLRLLQTGATVGRPRRTRHDVRTPDPRLEPLSVELMRLSDIEVWLRRTTLDDVGVHLPRTVRIGSYAANGPHIAGLDFGHDDPSDLDEHRIGILMGQVIDSVSSPTDPVEAPRTEP